MKKLSQVLAVGTVILAPLLASGSAFAVGTCPTGYTGPDSNNQCVSVTTYDCLIVNNNTVSIINENFQVAVTGDAINGSSGSATNSNGVTFNATIKNETCSVVATVAPIEPTPVVATPAETVQPVQAPAKAVATVLPNTSSDPVIGLLSGLIGALGVGGAASVIAAKFYNRIKS